MIGKDKIYHKISLACLNDRERILEMVDASGIRFLTMDWQSKINDQYLQDTKVKRAIQKVRNIYHLRIMKKMIEFCNINNIRIIFLKGCFLASELYEMMEDRQSKDIDCLIGIDDFLKVHELMLTMGFECDNLSDEEIENKTFVDVIKGYHAIYNKTEGKLIITVEVHCSITNSGNAFTEHSETFLNNSQRKSILGLEPCVLIPEYNLIYLMMHFVKQLPVYYLQYLLINKRIEFNLSNLWDMVLLIEKHKELLRWDIILQEATNMEIVEYVETVSCLINTFFGKIIADDFIDALRQRRNDTKLNKVQYVEYGFGIFMWMFSEFLETMRTTSAVDILKGKIGILGRPFDYAKQNGKELLIQRNKTVLKKTFQINLSNHEVATLELSVKMTDEKIYITQEVFSKECCKVKSGEDEFYHKDGVEILGINSDSVIHYMFSVGENNGPVISSQNDGDGVKRIWLNSLEYDMVEEEMYFKIMIALPYSVISDTVDGGELMINVGGLVSDPVTQTFTGNYMLFDSPGDFYNFSELPTLRFFD